jgi:hypothetical protein
MESPKKVLDEKSNETYIRPRMTLVLAHGSDEFEDVRCECGALLYKALQKGREAGTVLMKCRRCKQLSLT